MDGWNTSFLLGWLILGGYVSFREGILSVSVLSFIQWKKHVLIWRSSWCFGAAVAAVAVCFLGESGYTGLKVSEAPNPTSPAKKHTWKLTYPLKNAGWKAWHDPFFRWHINFWGEYNLKTMQLAAENAKWRQTSTKWMGIQVVVSVGFLFAQIRG